jgi:CRISPR type IV-associated protein Csf3
MQMQPMVISFRTDGTGVSKYPDESVHLDGLLSWAWRTLHGMDMDCDPHAIPHDADLPIERREYGGSWVFAASVLIPDIPYESVQMARRRFDDHRIEWQSSDIVRLDVGGTKTTNRPWPLVLARQWIGYCVGDVDAVRKLASTIRSIGRERGRGKGGIVGATVSPVDYDWSCQSVHGTANRYLPHKTGNRLVRPRPPYWHVRGRKKCLSPGEEIR